MQHNPTEMERDDHTQFITTKPCTETAELNVNDENKSEGTAEDSEEVNGRTREPLTTKNAIKLLLEGTLKWKVCRYCLNIDPALYEIDQIFQIAGQDSLYKVTIRDMVASFYPFQVTEYPHFPNRICTKCLDNTIQSYLFTQQCEQTGRALRNCFEDMYDKLDKLDQLEHTKKRGRHKLNPNYNTLYTEHEKVINYANPIINIVNRGCERKVEIDDKINELECPRCWQVCPNIQSLFNHEKIHPKSMWFHCRICGKSFVKRHLYRKHVKSDHGNTKQLPLTESSFKCLECNVENETYDQHLQHIEKHKFRMVMEHLVERKMDKLCTICFSKGGNMIKLDKTVNVHGGCPELTGHRTLYNILGSTMPEMNILTTYTGTKICDKCLNSSITSYVFLNHAHYARNRLKTCVELMLDSLTNVVKPDGKIFVEISQNMILPAKEPDYVDENLLIEAEEVDESRLKVEILEDEFRLKESESESDFEENKVKSESDSAVNIINNQKSTKLHFKGMVNGLKSNYNSVSVCSEFLTFKKKRKAKDVYLTKFTCPLCDKKFISDYFLRRHISRHVLRNAQCKICHTQFRSKFYLYEHTKVKHLLKNSNYIPCETCGRNFVNTKKFIRHTKSHKTKSCHLCDKIFTTQYYYNNHMQRHTRKLRIIREKNAQTCNFCKKACSDDNELTAHVNKVHLQIKPYNCDMCERQFYTEVDMSRHKKLHSMYTKEKCNFCSKNLNSRKALVIHIRKHIGAKPHNCLLCSQSFYSQGKLIKHMKIFHGGKFCCKLCKTVFVNKLKLKGHMNRAHNVI